MTPCPEHREALLTAGPETLRGRGDHPLVDHLESCAACRAAAHAILDETRGLDALLARVPEAPDPAALIRRARGESAIPTRRRGRWVAGAGLLAAAAAVGLLLLLPGPSLDPGPDQAHTRRAATPPLVEEAPDQNVAVLSTGNPDITVLWFF